MPSVKKFMLNNKVEMTTIEAEESIIAATYSMFTALNKFSFIQSLRMLLSEDSSDVLISLGLSGKGAMAVFIHFVARYRIFYETNTEDLRELCEFMDARNIMIYPSSLFNVFVIEKHLSERVNQRISRESIHQIMAHLMQHEVPVISQGLSSLVLYLTDAVHYADIGRAYRRNYFLYLDSVEARQRFIQVICNGYMHLLGNAEQQKRIQDKTLTLIDSNTSQICFPALKLLGLSVNINVGHYATMVKKYDSEIAQLKQDASKIISKIEQAKNDAHKKIDEEKEKVKLPEIVVGFNMVNMPVNLR